MKGSKKLGEGGWGGIYKPLAAKIPHMVQNLYSER